MSDSSGDEAVQPKKAGFSQLMDFGDDSDSPANKSSDDEVEVKAPVAAADKKKKKKKKEVKGKSTTADEDLEALLADLDKPAEQVSKSKKKKDKKKEVEVEETDKQEDDDNLVDQKDADTAPVDKKKDKKDKKKKAAKAAAAAASKENTPDIIDTTAQATEHLKLNDKEEINTEANVEEKEADVEGEADNEKPKKKDKKKKDKKGKDKEEKDKGDKKKKTHVDAIKDMLRKRQEEEERLKDKAAAEEKRLDELEDKRIEKLKLEKERKEREKEKRKAKIAQQKAEGTYMTADQKEKLRRAQANVEAMRQQGVVVPALDQNTTAIKPQRPKYIDKKKLRNKQMQKQMSQDADKLEPPAPVEAVTVIESKSTETSPETEQVSSAWDEEPKEDVADTWEMVEQEEVNPQPPPKEEVTPAKEESEEEQEESSDESSSEESSSEDESDEAGAKKETKEQIKEKVMARIEKRKTEANSKKDLSILRSPIICVLGHVDTGKTSLLDKIRRTHVQDGEAGGITQQIGATMVPAEAIREQAKMVKDLKPEDVKIPGFLIIDTPGHASFTNLRSRGSSLCDLAILVVDLMHGLEDQTLESIKLLQKGNTPFVVALNKIDRLYEWKRGPNKDIRACLKGQMHHCTMEFKERYDAVKTQFNEQGLNVALFWENPDPSEYISLLPTSAHSGDGMGNLIAYCTYYAQKYMLDRIAYTEELFCTVLEVKSLPGLGTTVDVILVNGVLHYGDVLVLAGTQGPIVTPVRELLMPQPLKEMRVKNPYERYKEIKGAQGIKILGKDLDHALAGLPLFVAHRDDEVDVLRDIVAENLKKALSSFRMCDKGVHVQASTLGSLEALLSFLKDEKIPYCGINIGPVHRKDVMKASTMLDHDAQWAVILAFDVKVEKDAQQMADEVGVKIFSADIIYHLEDAFKKHREELKKKQRQDNAHLAIFPCKLRVLPQFIFNSRNPIVMGVVVEQGILKCGTPICVPSQDSILLGAVSSVEINKKQVDVAKQGQEVCIKIENMPGETPKLYGRHFTHEDLLVSRIHRESIDVLKQYFREDLSKEDWKLIVELKKLLKIL